MLKSFLYAVLKVYIYIRSDWYEPVTFFMYIENCISYYTKASGRAHIVRWTMVLRRPKRSVDFWRISILINCGFRIVRKKKQCHIPDAASERV